MQTNKEDVAPSKDWWIVLHVVARISEEATATFRSLEGMTTLVCQQRDGIKKLATTYLNWFGREELENDLTRFSTEETTDSNGDDYWVVSNEGRY